MNCSAKSCPLLCRAARPLLLLRVRFSGTATEPTRSSAQALRVEPTSPPLGRLAVSRQRCGLGLAPRGPPAGGPWGGPLSSSQPASQLGCLPTSAASPGGPTCGIEAWGRSSFKKTDVSGTRPVPPESGGRASGGGGRCSAFSGATLLQHTCPGARSRSSASSARSAAVGPSRPCSSPAPGADGKAGAGGVVHHPPVAAATAAPTRM